MQQTTSSASILRKVFAWMLSLILFLNFISRPSYGFDIIHAQLFADILNMCIHNSLIPVVGAITSCLCLGETFYWKYLIAGALATAGIYIINKGKK